MLSVRLANTSIGSDLRFNVTLTNLDISQIFLLDYGVRVSIPCSGAIATMSVSERTTVTVVNSTNVAPGCTNPPPVAVDHGLPRPADNCMRTTPSSLSHGDTAQQYNDLCIDGAALKIVGSGVFEAIITVAWSLAPT